MWHISGQSARSFVRWYGWIWWCGRIMALDTHKNDGRPGHNIPHFLLERQWSWYDIEFSSFEFCLEKEWSRVKTQLHWWFTCPIFDTFVMSQVAICRCTHYPKKWIVNDVISTKYPCPNSMCVMVKWQIIYVCTYNWRRSFCEQKSVSNDKDWFIKNRKK